MESTGNKIVQSYSCSHGSKTGNVMEITPEKVTGALLALLRALGASGFWLAA